MAGRPSAAEKVGLNVSLEEQREGNWRIVLSEDDGTEVYDGIYRNADTCKTMASDPRPLTAGALVRGMLDRADVNEAQALELRTQADRLETEAKRLRAAADTLEGP